MSSRIAAEHRRHEFLLAVGYRIARRHKEVHRAHLGEGLVGAEQPQIQMEGGDPLSKALLGPLPREVRKEENGQKLESSGEEAENAREREERLGKDKD